MKLGLQWKWFLALAALLVALLLVVNLLIDLTLPPFLEEKIRTDLERNAVLARGVFAPKLAAKPVSTQKINALAHELSKQTDLRVTIIAADGTVIGESDKPPEELASIENHLQRPEVQEALRTGMGSATRRSDTIHVDLLYVAVAVRGVEASVPGRENAALATTDTQPPRTAASTTVPNDSLLGFVRVALPLHQVAETTARVRRTVAWASLMVGLVAIPIGLLLTRRITTPISEMRDTAARVARGDFSRKVRVDIGGELSELATALNDMSSQLEARLRDLNAEKSELAAILSNMTESVLVTDASGRIRVVNARLRKLFELGDEVIGKSVIEVFRNVSLDELVGETARTGAVSGRELNFLGPNEITFEMNAVSLRGRDSTRAGVLVVFHDITRLKQLENVRKEFVANVSHELRTPLSIIKGYVETLLDEQPPDEATARQFLQTIQKHSHRLETLIEDLLSISALESQQARLDLASVSLHAAATAVIDELQRQASAKSMNISLEIPAQFTAARADAQRLHQVLFNLLDNAVKYTQPGGRAIVLAKEKDGEIEVCVSDNGPGIGAEHLPHVFERFYRVDKARSRELGGTGLGLSIVKHIVQAHGGRVWAESQIEKGSAFYFTLPRAQ